MKNVIAVDDDRKVLETYRMVFEESELQGFNLLTFDHPAKAAPFYADADLILLDVNIPGAPDVKTNIEDAKRRSGCPVLVISGERSLEKLLEGTLADDWLYKPMDMDLLIETIVNMTNRVLEMSDTA